MVLPEILRRFAQADPIAVMARLVLDRIFEPAKLDEWFKRVANRQYTRELLFSSVFEIMSLVAFKAFPTVHAAYQRLRGRVGVSITALYDKLAALEPQTARAMVRDTAAEMAHAVVQLKGARPSLIPGYRVKILDGNCIAATEHRLKVVRKTKAGPLPGKSLVVYDPALEIAIDVHPCEDGHAQERSLLSEILSTVEPGDVWVMDRNFCVRDFLEQMEARGGYFICRHHRGLSVTPVGPEQFAAETETGAVYEQWVSFGSPGAGTAHRYRLIRVSLKSKTRDGDKDLFILTNLPTTAADAKLIAKVYRDRWTIETMFQALKRDLHSEVNTLGYPKAALFSFCTALVGANVFAVLKAALRATHGEAEVAMISGYYVSLEIAQCHRGMQVAIKPETWSRLRKVSHAEFLALLAQVASDADLTCYRKHPRGPKKPQPKRIEHAGKTHVSTARLLREQKARR